MTDWIKFPENKPVHDWVNSRFIVYGSPSCGTHSEDMIVMEASYRKDGYFEFGEYDCNIDVTHWMPLPSPPKDDV
jgi:uncharacterized protein DUF551